MSSFITSNPYHKFTVNHARVFGDLPTPLYLASWWNFGSLLGVCLVVQILTGLFLAIHYIPHSNIAFSSLAHITRDVQFGWLLRNIHANGASIFFVAIYTHVGRGVYYISYNNVKAWNLGVIILIITIATAFLGYVLPWGQISFWGATVITNLLSAIPYIGPSLVKWVWGGFAVSTSTLNRFFVLHFIMPFALAAITIIHLMFIHEYGGNNPLGIISDRIHFHPSYSLKDLTGGIIFLILLVFLGLLLPCILGDTENFIPANPLSTPIHIKPEWYFLWAYAILRSYPSKVGGVIAMFAAILVLFTLPITTTKKRNFFNPLGQFLFWVWAVTCVILTWIGGCAAEEPYIFLGQILTTLYFIYFILRPLVPYIWKINNN